MPEYTKKSRPIDGRPHMSTKQFIEHSQTFNTAVKAYIDERDKGKKANPKKIKDYKDVIDDLVNE